MKRIIVFSCAVLFIANLLFGLLLSAYEWFNVFVSSMTIVLYGAFMLLIGMLPLKEGFKASFYIIYPILSLVEFVLSLFSANRLTDNWIIIVLMCVVLFQIILLFVANVISNKIK